MDENMAMDLVNKLNLGNLGNLGSDPASSSSSSSSAPVPIKKAPTRMFFSPVDHVLEDDPTVPTQEQDFMPFVHRVLDTNRVYFLHPIFGRNTWQDHWPQTTSIACLHDCERFETSPVPCVDSYDELRSVYNVYGVFCSLNCAKAYMIEHEPALSTRRLLEFQHMCSHVYKIHEPVKPAPPRIMLERFGGPMTLEEFRAPSKSVITVMRPPFVESTLLLCKIKEGAIQDGQIVGVNLAASLEQARNCQMQEDADPNSMFSEFLARKRLEPPPPPQDDPLYPPLVPPSLPSAGPSKKKTAAAAAKNNKELKEKKKKASAAAAKNPPPPPTKESKEPKEPAKKRAKRVAKPPNLPAPSSPSASLLALSSLASLSSSLPSSSSSSGQGGGLAAFFASAAASSSSSFS